MSRRGVVEAVVVANRLNHRFTRAVQDRCEAAADLHRSGLPILVAQLAGGGEVDVHVAVLVGAQLVDVGLPEVELLRR